MPPDERTKRARQLRTSQTRAERLLWNVLRAGQLSGMKFRRQHPIGPYFADFACIAHRVIVELDGGYHDLVQGRDLERQALLEAHGWRVLRFTNQQVIDDVESVAMAIAQEMNVAYTFRGRSGKQSGMLSKKGLVRDNGTQSDTSD